MANLRVDDLLKLLDHEKALRDYCIERYSAGPGYTKSSWWYEVRCDLAFRLRDEAVKEHRADWRSAQHLVVSQAAEQGQAPPLALPGDWWADYAQPQHYIVAALIAQELAREGKEQG